MPIVMFYHSLVSDWNHGNAHFLRGLVRELKARGQDVVVYEPRDNWSLANLRKEHGDEPIARFEATFPGLRSIGYEPATLDLDAALDGADLVIVHEWNDRELVHRIGQHRKARGGYGLLFHDTHHRAVTRPEEISSYDLTHFDGVLAFGRVLRDLYLKHRWTKRAWIFHEAADVQLFHPLSDLPNEGDLIWIGNWGDGERSEELREFLIEPIQALGLKARIHGVRYPAEAKKQLAEAGIDYRGWIANFDVPEAFARFKLTVHVPRRPYVEALPGIPTIRVFEALACGMPLICAPWEDAEHLFEPGADYLIANDGEEMKRHLQRLLREPAEARALAEHGRRTILDRHTCAHRADQLLTIASESRA